MNLFLFFVGVSLVLAAILLVMATTPFKNRWDFYANAPLEVRTSQRIVYDVLHIYYTYIAAVLREANEKIGFDGLKEFLEKTLTINRQWVVSTS